MFFTKNATISPNLFHFIVESQKELSNNKSYWIGGSARTKGNFEFVHYLPYQMGPGEIKYTLMLFCLSLSHLHPTLVINIY